MPLTRRSHLLMLAVPALAAVAVHAPVLDGGFAFDDPVAVVDNPLVDGRAPWHGAFTRNFWGDRPGWAHLASWRPLTVLSLRLDHALGAGAPGPFHAANLAWLVALVLAALALALGLGLPPPAAAAVGLVVAVHPAFSEAVASLVGRGDLVAATLGLLALAVLHRRAALALALLALALLAKETAVVALAAAVVLALLEGRRRVAVAAVALGVAWYAARAAAVGTLGGAVPAVDNPIAAMDLGERAVAALAVVGRYVSWWLVPRPVAADHALGVDLAGPAGLYGVLGALALGALAVVGVRALRARRGALAVGVSLAGASLVLLSNGPVLLPTPLAGRLAVLPALGLTLAAAAGLVSAPPRVRGLALVLAGAWLLAGIPAARQVDAAWHDDRALFTLSVAVEPASVRARTNLASQLRQAGEPDAAARHLDDVLARFPRHAPALLEASLVAADRGQADEAWRLALSAARHERVPGRAAANTCALALARPELDGAERIARCEAAVVAVPDRPEPAVNLARALAAAGRHGEADAAFVRALQAFPDAVFAVGHRVAHLRQTGRIEDAVALQRGLADRGPEHARNLVALLLEVAAARAGAGDTRAACEAAEEAVRRSGGHPEVRARAAAACPR